MMMDNYTCEDPIDTPLFLHYSLIPSVLIILTLSFFERPVNSLRFQNRVPLLNKRFGLMIPLDLLGNFNNRWTFGFAYGVIANKVFSLFLQDFSLPGVPSWARAFDLFGVSIEVGLSFYPMFACLSTDCQLFGSVAGFLYTLAWFSVTVINTALCPSGQGLGKYEKVILNWPTLLCLAFLLGTFVLLFIKSIRMCWRPHIINEDKSFLKVHQAEHVKRLLRKPEWVQQSWFQRKIYAWDPCFKFPSRMLGTSVLSLFCLYILVTAVFNSGKNMIKLLNDFLLSVAPDSNSTINEFNRNLMGVWSVTTFLSTAISVSHVFHILICYRKHMRRLWAGNKRFFPESFHNPSPSSAVAAITKYCGSQVGFVLWGFMIMHFVQFVFGMAFVYSFIQPLKHNPVIFLKDLGIGVLTFLMFVLLFLLQPLLAGKFFLQNKISPLDKKKPLALNNRRGFHNFSYFLFFYNVIIGFGFSMFRLLCSLFLGSFLIARIDRPILQRGYERADLGYKSWIGMLYVDHYHTNPALVCFCNILLTANAEKGSAGRSGYSSLNNATGPRISARARTRWLLWYTLLKNPRLITQRKQGAIDDMDMDNTTAQNRLFQASVREVELRSQQSKPNKTHNEERSALI